jgi:hypothetical protein
MKRTDKIKKVFIRFLKREGVYHNFITNTASLSGISLRTKHFDNNSTFYDIVNDDIKYNDGRNIIYFSFYWGETSEGDEFWRILDRKWRYIIMKL